MSSFLGRFFARTFAPLIAALPQRFHFVSIDFRGWGSSTGPKDPSKYSIQDLANDVEIVIERLQLRDFVLIGHSMGGKVVQLMGGRGNTKGLRGVILLAPAPPTPLILPTEMRETQMTAYSSVESATFVIENVLTSSSLSDEKIKLLVEDTMRGSPAAVSAWPSYSVLEDISAQFQKITV